MPASAIKRTNKLSNYWSSGIDFSGFKVSRW